MMSIWIHSPLPDTGMQALGVMGSIISRGTSTPEHFYAVLDNDVELRKQTYATLMRNLRDENTVGPEWVWAVTHTVAIYQSEKYAIDQAEAATRRKLFWLTIATCRRQFCHEGALENLHTIIPIFIWCALPRLIEREFHDA